MTRDYEITLGKAPDKVSYEVEFSPGLGQGSRVFMVKGNNRTEIEHVKSIHTDVSVDAAPTLTLVLNSPLKISTKE